MYGAWYVQLTRSRPYNSFPACAKTYLGDLTQSFLKPGNFPKEQNNFELRLFKWIKTLPENLQLYNKNSNRLKPYSVKARQLHIQVRDTFKT
jgi:hypothetical protein